MISPFPTAADSLDRLSGLEHGAVHLVPAICEDARISEFHLIAQEGDGGELFRHPKLCIHRVWKVGSVTNPWRIASRVRALKPDVVHFYLHMGYIFGRNDLTNGLGLLSPAFVRLLKERNVTTLCNIVEAVDLDLTVYGRRLVSVWAARLLQRVVIVASRKVVLLSPNMFEQFSKHYGSAKAVLIPHGVWDFRPKEVSTKQDSILVFGKIAPHKAFREVLNAFAYVRRRFPWVTLVVAGDRHPYAPWLYDELRDLCARVEGVVFRGYVAEGEIGPLFERAIMQILPYRTGMGSSGSMLRAIGYLVPCVGSDIDEFVSYQRAGAGLLLYRVDDPQNLAAMIGTLLANGELRRQLRARNRAFAERQPFHRSVDMYIRLFYWVAGAKTEPALQELGPSPLGEGPAQS